MNSQQNYSEKIYSCLKIRIYIKTVGNSKNLTSRNEICRSLTQRMNRLQRKRWVNELKSEIENIPIVTRFFDELNNFLTPRVLSSSNLCFVFVTDDKSRTTGEQGSFTEFHQRNVCNPRIKRFSFLPNTFLTFSFLPKWKFPFISSIVAKLLICEAFFTCCFHEVLVDGSVTHADYSMRDQFQINKFG